MAVLWRVFLGCSLFSWAFRLEFQSTPELEHLYLQESPEDRISLDKTLKISIIQGDISLGIGTVQSLPVKAETALVNTSHWTCQEEVEIAVRRNEKIVLFMEERGSDMSHRLEVPVRMAEAEFKRRNYEKYVKLAIEIRTSEFPVWEVAFYTGVDRMRSIYQAVSLFREGNYKLVSRSNKEKSHIHFLRYLEFYGLRSAELLLSCVLEESLKTHSIHQFWIYVFSMFEKCSVFELCEAGLLDAGLGVDMVRSCYNRHSQFDIQTPRPFVSGLVINGEPFSGNQEDVNSALCASLAIEAGLCSLITCISGKEFRVLDSRECENFASERTLGAGGGGGTAIVVGGGDSSSSDNCTSKTCLIISVVVFLVM